MITKIDKNADRIKRHQRVRKKVSGTAECPRLSVFRSLNHIYAQIIDDVKGNTLVACSTVEKAVAEAVKDLSKKEAAKVVGQEVAKRALEKGIKEGCGVDAPGSLVSYLCEQIPVYALDIKDGIRYDIGTLESYEEVKRIFAAKNK